MIRRKFSYGDELNQEPLDSCEQEQLIQTVKLQANSEARIIRFMFSLLFYGLATLMTYCLIRNWQDPFEFIVPDYIHISKVSNYITTTIALLSVFDFWLSAHLCKEGFKYVNVVVALLAILATVVMWYLIFWEMHFKFVSLHSIVPLLNVVCILIAIYVNHEMNRLVQDVGHLNSLKYEFKKV